MKEKTQKTASVSSTSISVPPKRTINQKANQTQERHSFRYNPCSAFFVCTQTNPFQMVITCEICAQMAPFVGIFAFQSSAKICQPCMPCHILIAIKTDFHFNVHSPQRVSFTFANPNQIQRIRLLWQTRDNSDYESGVESISANILIWNYVARSNIVANWIFLHNSKMVIFCAPTNSFIVLSLEFSWKSICFFFYVWKLHNAHTNLNIWAFKLQPYDWDWLSHSKICIKLTRIFMLLIFFLFTRSFFPNCISES